MWLQRFPCRSRLLAMRCSQNSPVDPRGQDRIKRRVTEKNILWCVEMSLRVAFFTDSYLPYNSGVVHSIEILRRGITSLGHRVFVFAPRYPNCSGAEGDYFRFAAVPSPTNRDYYLALPFLRQLKEIVRQIRPHVIHTHHPFSMGWMGLRCAKTLDIPLVYTCHTLYEYYSHYLPIPRPLATRIIRKVYVNYGNKCDVIITPSGVTRDYLRQLDVTVPIEVIPTGVSEEDFAALQKGWLRKRYNIKPGEKVLLCVGRLGKEKNIQLVLECFALVSRIVPEVRLVLVGKGPLEKELARLAGELGVGEKVFFTGLLPQRDVIKCYQDADVFVFASVSETQGLVITEAKSAGLPVVAVKANGVSEMVQDGGDGFLTGPLPDQMAKKIILLLQNEELRRKMARNARSNAAKLSAGGFAAAVMQVYLSVLQAGRPAGDRVFR